MIIALLEMLSGITTFTRCFVCGKNAENLFYFHSISKWKNHSAKLTLNQSLLAIQIEIFIYELIDCEESVKQVDNNELLRVLSSQLESNGNFEAAFESRVVG